MQRTIVCTCPICGKIEPITADDADKLIKITSRVLGVTVNFKNELVYAVAMYERKHWLEHCKEELEKEREPDKRAGTAWKAV